MNILIIKKTWFWDNMQILKLGIVKQLHIIILVFNLIVFDIEIADDTL